MGLKSDCLLFIETYRDSAKKSSYILNMLELIKEFCLGNRKKGIQNLERLIDCIDKKQDIEKKIFLLEWMIEELQENQDFQRAFLFEKEVNALYLRRSSLICNELG